MKLKGSNLLALGVIVLAVKMCGNDSPTTPKPQTVAPQANSQAFSPTMESNAIAAEKEAATRKRRYVGPRALNTRSAPNGSINGSLQHGVAVDIYDEEKGWGRISLDGQPPQWVSLSYLCTAIDCNDTPKWKTKPISPPVTPSRQAPRSQPSESSSYGCSCSSGNNCYGPRGGRYCITSGGNKRYR